MCKQLWQLICLLTSACSFHFSPSSLSRFFAFLQRHIITLRKFVERWICLSVCLWLSCHCGCLCVCLSAFGCFSSQPHVSLSLSVTEVHLPGIAIATPDQKSIKFHSCFIMMLGLLQRLSMGSPKSRTVTPRVSVEHGWEMCKTSTEAEHVILVLKRKKGVSKWINI